MKAVISFLIFILEGVAKALTFLLTSLGLWIPALFSLLFILVCAITKTPFSEVGGFFYVGLTLTFLMSVGISVHQVLKNKIKKNEQRGGSKKRVDKVTGKSKKQNRVIENQSTQDSAYVFSGVNSVSDGFDSTPRGYNPPQGYVPPQQSYNSSSNYAQTPQQGYAPPQNYTQPSQQNYASQPNYAQTPPQGYVPPQNYTQTPPQGYAQPQNYTQPSQQNYTPPQNYEQSPQPGFNQSSYNQPVDYGAARDYEPQPKRSLYEEAKADFARGFDGYNKPQENISAEKFRSDFESEKPSAKATYDHPLVFRTRSDPNVLIYEYPDKYVFYRKNYGGNLEYIKTENK